MIDETYNEVWKLLNNIPLRDYLKIPKKEISEILKNKIPNYSDRKISEENIKAVSTEALKIYTRLYYNYIATKEEKNKIEEILKINSKNKAKKVRKTIDKNQRKTYNTFRTDIWYLTYEKYYYFFGGLP